MWISDFTLGCSEEAQGTSGEEEDESKKKQQVRKEKKQIWSAPNHSSPPAPRKKKRAPRSPGYEAAVSSWPSKSATRERRGSPPYTAANPSWCLTGVEEGGRKWEEGQGGRKGMSFIGHGFREGRSTR